MRIFKQMLMVAGVCAVSGLVAYGQTDLAGTWKMDAAKSKLTGDTLHFAPAAGGAIKRTSGSESYTFKPDGSPTVTPFKETVKWTKQSDTHYTESASYNGMDLGMDTWEISPDGKTLKDHATGTHPDGTPFTIDATYTRMGSGMGLMGDWKDSEVKGATGNYVITANADGSIQWLIPEIKGVLTLRADGKDVAPVGPTVPAGLTIALTRKGPHSYGMVEKMSGKPVFLSTMSLSADGKMLSEVGSAVGVHEPATIVYVKQ